jgi:hypothetical protein
MAKAKREFTVQDMKKAFEAGARSDGGGSWSWQRWMRVEYEGRYVRRPRRRPAKEPR